MYMVQLVISDENYTLSFVTNNFVILVLMCSQSQSSHIVIFFFAFNFLSGFVYFKIYSHVVILTSIFLQRKLSDVNFDNFRYHRQSLFSIFGTRSQHNKAISRRIERDGTVSRTDMVFQGFCPFMCRPVSIIFPIQAKRTLYHTWW